MLNNFLTLIGLLSAVHLICTATFLSPKAPFTVITEVAVGFACAIGVIVTSLQGDVDRLVLFTGVLALCLVLFSLETTLRNKSVYTRKRIPLFR